MSQARPAPSADRMRELAEKARDDGLHGLASWLDDCAEKAEVADD